MRVDEGIWEREQKVVKMATWLLERLVGFIKGTWIVKTVSMI